MLPLAIAACRPPAESPGPLHLETSRAGADTRVTLVARAGVKLSARLKPALELADGTVLRFDSPHLTPDSAYFAEPPSARLRGRHDRVGGIIRASVCDDVERVCRTVTLQL